MVLKFRTGLGSINILKRKKDMDKRNFIILGLKMCFRRISYIAVCVHGNWEQSRKYGIPIWQCSCPWVDSTNSSSSFNFKQFIVITQAIKQVQCIWRQIWEHIERKQNMTINSSDVNGAGNFTGVWASVFSEQDCLKCADNRCKRCIIGTLKVNQLLLYALISCCCMH